MSTITTDLELSICGFDCSQEVTLTYEYEPKCGDGWSEPFQSASVELLRADAEYVYAGLLTTMNILPLLTAQCVDKIEAWLVGEHEENAKRDVAMEWA